MAAILEYQGLCNCTSELLNGAITWSVYLDASQQNDISKHTILLDSPTYCNHKKNWCLHSLQMSGNGSLCNFLHRKHWSPLDVLQCRPLCTPRDIMCNGSHLHTCNYCIRCFNVEVVYSQLNMISLWDLDDIGTVQVVSIAGVARWCVCTVHMSIAHLTTCYISW